MSPTHKTKNPTESSVAITAVIKFGFCLSLSESKPLPANHHAGRQKNGNEKDRQASTDKFDGCQLDGQEIGRESIISIAKAGIFTAVKK